MKYLFVRYLSAGIAALLLSFSSGSSERLQAQLKVSPFTVLPYDTPLDAVKWTNGFWHDRMERLRNIYFPGVIDGSFISARNGSTFRNFVRAAGLEEGGWLGKSWGDGDCYFVLDVASRLYAYKPDDYLRGKLDYWIPVIAAVQRPDGFLDTWTVLNKPRAAYHYNMAHLYKTAVTHHRATSEDALVKIADSYLSYYISHNLGTYEAIPHACGLRYIRTGDTAYLNILQNYYRPDKPNSTFGPPFRVAREINGHNTQTFHELNGAALLYEINGEQALLDALKRLADNLLSSKIFITGAVAPVQKIAGPIKIDGKEYKVNMNEAVGDAYDLPNETSYCESCGQSLYMEFFYRMFRLTGDAKYMDAAERMLYNTTTGCVDLDNPNFFYANPQEQFQNSMRFDSSSHAEGKYHYTWKRTFLKQASCCPPKVMRSIAMCNEIAYSVNDQGLWVNLYGGNTFSAKLPGGGSVECTQSSDYPWDGKIVLKLDKVKSEKPLKIFMRIPGWVNRPVEVMINRKSVINGVEGGRYVTLDRKWRDGDRIELKLPMPVRYMIADPRVKENIGKVAVMRGPVVYCLENADIPEGFDIDSLFITGGSTLEPVFTEELGGVTKLKGTMVGSSEEAKMFDTSADFKQGSDLYRETDLNRIVSTPAKTKKADISLVPFCTRLNRESRYFKVWLPAITSTP